VRGKEVVMGKSLSNRSFEELRLEESKILEQVEGEILPVQGTERCLASLKTMCFLDLCLTVHHQCR
jgi:hypothetical protein